MMTESVVLSLSVDISKSMVPEGGDVAVIGSLDEFGAWDVTKAVPMLCRNDAAAEPPQLMRAFGSMDSLCSVASLDSNDSEMPTSNSEVQVGSEIQELQANRFIAGKIRVGNRAKHDTWYLQVVLPLRAVSDSVDAATLEYKYVVRDGDHRIVLWEVILENRLVYPGRMNCTQNLAAVARQSSTWCSNRRPFSGPRPAKTAMNGRRLSMHEWHCSHTQLDAQPWWDVDLGDSYDIDFVRIWNRQGVCANRIYPFWLLLSDTPFPPWRANTLEECRKLSSYEQRIDESMGFDDTIDIITSQRGKTKARYVRVCVEREAFLHFGQLEVMSCSAAMNLASNSFSSDIDKPFEQGDRSNKTNSKTQNGGLVNGTAMLSSTTLVSALAAYGSTVFSLQSGSDSLFHSVHDGVVGVVPTRRVINNVYLDDLSRKHQLKESAKVPQHNGKIDNITREVKAVKEGIAEASFSRTGSGIGRRGREQIDGEWLGPPQQVRQEKVIVPGRLTINLGTRATLSGSMPAIIVRDQTLIKSNSTKQRLLIKAFARGLRHSGQKMISVPAIVSDERESFIMQPGKDPSLPKKDEGIVWSKDETCTWRFDVGNVDDFKACSIEFHFFIETADSSTGTFSHTSPTPDGIAYVLPSQLFARADSHSRGNLTCPILRSFPQVPNGSPMAFDPIFGEMFGHFTLVKAYSGYASHRLLKSVHRRYWNPFYKPLDVGHRGLGKSHHKSLPEYRLSGIRENSLMSFLVAGMLGADFIEFDVLLTSDRVPVVYHDMEIQTSLKGHRNEAAGDPLVVGVHQLTLQHLERCHLEFKPKHSYKLKEFVQRNMEAILTFTENGRALLRKRLKQKRTPRLLRILETIPTLESLFHCLPVWIGFNIEIKYPIECKHRHLRTLAQYELNEYVDRILECVFTHAGKRRIFFSCFDPDVCTALHQKQPKYPVFFLTCAGTCVDFVDERCLTIDKACAFAKAEGLQGIVTESTCILEDPSLVPKIKGQGLVVITWGHENTRLGNVVAQKKLGVDGIISDNISDLTRMQGKVHNIFRDDLDLLAATSVALQPQSRQQTDDFNRFRSQYRSFREGQAKGARGEVSRFVPTPERGVSSVKRAESKQSHR